MVHFLLGYKIFHFSVTASEKWRCWKNDRFLVFIVFMIYGFWPLWPGFWTKASV